MIFSKAQRLNERGHELKAKGWFVEAEAAYRAAAAAKPAWSVPWYNLGLMQKYRGKWEESLDCNLRATELDPEDEASWWNLGIAATALGRWNVARRAWRSCGLAIPPGDGQIEMEMGHVPIRLVEPGAGEVVWSRRIDPARAILTSVPLPDSRHRWGDLVLHDGAPNGYRTLRGRQVPVFDALSRLVPSALATFLAEIDAGAEDLAALSHVADELGGAAEDWSTNTRILCEACSKGSPGHVHDATNSVPAHPHCGIAARDEGHVREILAAWLARTPNGRVIGCRPAS